MTSDHSLRSIRPPAVAGSFYPSDPGVLRASVDRMLAAADLRAPDVVVRLLIVPHAGYVYSGPVAATAYRLLPTVDRKDRVVVLGPSHFVGLAGLATPGVDGFATPMGVVPVDAGLSAIAESRAAVASNPAPHAPEHSIEVQLPFLQAVLQQFALLALLTGKTQPETVAEVLGDLTEQDDVLVIISSDLSHYLGYEAARRRDGRTARAIVAGRPDHLGEGDACGLIGVQAALLLARRHGWECSQLDLRSSGDTAGGRDTVVGYGAFVIGPTR